MKSFLLVRSYRVLVINIKILIIGALGTLETRLKVPIFAIFEVFRAYLREFSIFFHEIYMVASSYQVLVANIKSLLITVLVSLETRLKVTIFAIF